MRKKKDYGCSQRSPIGEQRRFGINVSVADGCCQALMSKKHLHVTQVGSSLVEQKRRGRMIQRIGGNDRHPRMLACELNPDVEGLVAKGSAASSGKD
jgi:hypothetical protein